MITCDCRYADNILQDTGGPDAYDSIEIQGVRDLPPVNGVMPVEPDNERPEYFSVYLHYRPHADPDIGGLECVGDFLQLDRAEAYAADLSREFGWPVHNLLTSPTHKVEHHFSYGWDDAGWTDDDKPLRFGSAKEAQSAIDSFIKSAAHLGYRKEQFRTAPCPR